MRQRIARVAAATVAALLAMAIPATAEHTALDDATSASGTFAFRTGNGILPTWERAGLRLTGIAPARVITSTLGASTLGTNASVTMPVVARDGSANFAGGGFRIANVKTGASITCASPNVDTRARVVDCVTRDGANLSLFSIPSLGTRRTFSGSVTTTTAYRGMVLRIGNQRVADALNDELDVAVFSPYVTVATADLTVTTGR